MSGSRPKFKKLAVKAARLADGKKAEDVAVYDLTGRSALADYAVTATVDSPAHLEAVDDEIAVKLKHDGVYPLYRDGAQSRTWKVLDYGGLIVHIIERQTRLRYALDGLFNGLKQVPWEEKAAPAAEKPVRKKVAEKAPKKAVRKKRG